MDEVVCYVPGLLPQLSVVPVFRAWMCSILSTHACHRVTEPLVCEGIAELAAARPLRSVRLIDAGRTLEVSQIDGDQAAELRNRAGAQFVAFALEGLSGEISSRWSIEFVEIVIRAHGLDIGSTLGFLTS